MRCDKRMEQQTVGGTRGADDGDIDHQNYKGIYK